MAQRESSIPSEIYLKSGDVDSMDESDVEERDIFMYARSDPYPTDERKQNHNKIEDPTMEDDPYFFLLKPPLSPLS